MSMWDRLVFVRVGWLTYYDQSRDVTTPLGGGSYNDEYIGAEVDSFRPLSDGRCYGYGKAGDKNAFNLERIAPGANGDSIENCLVVSVATCPYTKALVVVGWHAQATVYRHYGTREEPGSEIYNFSAMAEDCVLLPEIMRTWGVPSQGRETLGQSNVFYALAENGKPRASGRSRWIARISRHIKNYSGPNLLSSGSLESLERELESSPSYGQGWGLSARERQAVDEAAMECAINHFRDQGFDVKDVHRTHSYDLEVERQGKRRKVEVKGTTGSGGKVLLTRNEVELARKEDVILFVISGISLELTGSVVVGHTDEAKVNEIDGWDANSERLRPLTYEFEVIEE